jgi:hypothetical protein
MNDILVVVFFISYWQILRTANSAASRPALAGIILGCGLLWGAAWSFVPQLSALRLLPPPAGQAPIILISILSFTSLFMFSKVRAFFSGVDVFKLMWLGPWRLVFGALLLVSGLFGALPAGFFWPAALGDMAAGLWSIYILARAPEVRRWELLAWNIFGLADLVDALLQGAIYLRPFFLAHPELPALNLLPLIGVPLFIASHFVILWNLYSTKREVHLR